MKKIISIILSVALSAILLGGCSQIVEDIPKSEKSIVYKDIKVIIPDGLPAIAIAKLSKENPQIKEGYNITYIIEKTPENLSTAVMKEEADIAIVPSNMAAIAYNKTSNYQIAGTVGNGSFYLVSTKDINKFEDLVGMDVWNTGKNLTPDITVKSILKNKEIDTESINFNYVNSASELIPLMATGKADTGFVPEPALTTLITKNPDIKVIKSLNDSWKDTSNSKEGYPQSTVIVKSNFAKENEEFINLFLGQISNSINWSNTNGNKAGEYAKEIGASAEPEIIEKAMKRANLKFTPAKYVIADYNNYYQNLFDFDIKSVGGKLPDEGIYFIQE